MKKIRHHHNRSTLILLLLTLFKTTSSTITRTQESGASAADLITNVSTPTKYYFAYHNPSDPNLHIHDAWDGTAGVLHHTFTCTSDVYGHSQVTGAEELIVACHEEISIVNLDTKSTTQTYNLDTDHKFKWVTELNPQGFYLLVDNYSFGGHVHVKYDYNLNTVTNFAALAVNEAPYTSTLIRSTNLLAYGFGDDAATFNVYDSTTTVV